MKERTFLWVLIIIFMTTGLEAQDRSEIRKQRKHERQEIRQEQLSEIESWVRDSAFVIEAERLQGRYGNSFFVYDGNFIKVNGDEVVLQTSNPGLVGYNGLGGVTLNGRILDYQMTRDENGINLIIQMVGSLVGNGTLNVSIYDAQSVRAYYSGPWGSRLVYYGTISHPDSTFNFEGQDFL